MELIFNQYCFDIKNCGINCIMGNGINLEDFKDACKYSNNVELIIQPVTNQILYKTVKKELTYAFNQSNHRNNEKILDSLKLVGLNNQIINKKIESLSSSELYLISLASQLIKNPKIIILDNPNAYLDLKNINNFLKIIRTIKRRYNKTIIIFSNDSDFVNSISDYIFIINDKKIIKEGNKYDIFIDDITLKSCQIKVPKIIEFEKKVLNNKSINIGFRDNVNDLIKDIYYYK